MGAFQARHAVVHEQREAVAEPGVVEGPLQLADHYPAWKPCPGSGELLDRAVATRHP
ncbi:hypothetical protein ACFYZE_08595 [Streptomyces sp. NPDC001796]|uniref:hypothetical protein n=1 Tax=Streptomyces sp. NPDC001796 TaxID=3364609 RepID=UPI0036BE7B1B